MTIQTPTTAEINANIIAQLEASLNRSVPLLPRSFLRVLAKALAGVMTILYKYAGFIFLQVFVTTASFRETEVNGRRVVPLIEWGRLIGVGDPKESEQAELTIILTVESQGGVLPINSQLLNAQTGVTYLTLSGVELNAPTKTVLVRAVADQTGTGGAGALGNMNPGDVMAFVNPQAAVAQSTTVESQNVTGAEAESEAAYRQRVVERFQRRPQGGAYADYEQWGEAVAGILNVYPYTSDCPGQVDVYVEATEASSGSADGIPTLAQLESVLAAIELDENGLASLRPAGALVNAFPIKRKDFTVTVSGLAVADLATTREEVTAAVKEFFLTRAPYIVGLNVPPRADRITASGVAGVVDDIVSARGGIFSGSVITLDSNPIDIYTLGIGEKAKAGAVVYV